MHFYRFLKAWVIDNTLFIHYLIDFAAIEWLVSAIQNTLLSKRKKTKKLFFFTLFIKLISYFHR